MADFAVSLKDIVKEFPGVRALDSASLEVKSGEVHGLVGENGAGKSTVIKVLAGVYQPEAGSIMINGQSLNPATPAAVHDAGIRFIHQELHLVPHFTVTESVFMGQELRGRFGIAKREMRRRAEAFLRDNLGLPLSGNRLIRDLGPAERKLVQVARALIDGAAQVVVFDEPTAPLAIEEVDLVMGAIAKLKAQGIAILYVSHYLSEITDICDRVTVFRQGETVGVFDNITAASSAELIYAMVGRAISDMFPARTERSVDTGLSVRGLAAARAFSDVSFEAGRGEILGIAGLIGSGREELTDCLYGLRKRTAGTVSFEGRSLDLNTAAKAVAQGVVLVPRDRRNDGLVLPMSVSENATLATLDRTSRAGLVDAKAAAAATESHITALDIRPPNPDAITRLLSGGNQQKVVLARWLATDAKVFIFDEPTVGVDVGAKAEIYQLIADLAGKGASVIVSSSDPVELQGICDRIIVMMRGKIVDELRASDASVDDLVAATTGAASVQGAAHAG
ncbi:sugar ABC transporter ATP-binding protein [Roseobacter cerasinus]|uniref:Sugar ABC transporter ATP-binding protein n=1 Tax=Roseobacter cerasinus TaxID=2602289 RepID=A0A640VV07_9RHOB|nr:sugar ABC transporter ATP-binding protein [Roseobacter cerasinus]GFE51859.1 sugar ABC transporter ATP-binding protein [Roseobacter cerasinus]